MFTLSTGYSEPSSAGCKQYTVGFTALDDSSSTATAEIAVNGMDPPELGFSPAESTTGTSGQSHPIHTLTSNGANRFILQFLVERDSLDANWKQEWMKTCSGLGIRSTARYGPYFLSLSFHLTTATTQLKNAAYNGSHGLSYSHYWSVITWGLLPIKRQWCSM